jgi:hypothetical protein
MTPLVVMVVGEHDGIFRGPETSCFSCKVESNYFFWLILSDNVIDLPKSARLASGCCFLIACPKKNPYLSSVKRPVGKYSEPLIGSSSKFSRNILEQF